jgi:uncharacterized protein (DUF1800 family)
MSSLPLTLRPLRALAGVAAATLGALTLTAQAQVSSCPFRVSGNSTLSATVDAVLLQRYARGLRGSALVAGFSGLTAATVETNITTNLPRLDINANGILDRDDAAAVARYAFGLPTVEWVKTNAGTNNDHNLASNYAVRNTKARMDAFLAAGCPTWSFTAPTADELAAARFLIQTTFGPTRAQIAALATGPLDPSVGGSAMKQRASRWINDQFAMPRSQSHYDYVAQRKTEIGTGYFGPHYLREAFWKQALDSPDQLRQRLAFALSQVLVVSSDGGTDNPLAIASYLDVLADNAFGNYRDILMQVARSPAMGLYLSHLRNDGRSATPNENFAREILQLFAVGLFQLNMNGEKVLVGGEPVASYDEDVVKGFARVFTGFTYDDPYCRVDTSGLPAGAELPAAGYAVTPPTCTDGYGGVHPSWDWNPTRDDLGANFPPVDRGWQRPMVAFPTRHHAGSKQLLKYGNYTGSVPACAAAIAMASATTNPGLLPAIDTTGSGFTTGTRTNKKHAYDTLNAAIDNIFCHPNVGPFISRHLIKFLVTSNPTPAYVGRVAAVFNNNGSGVRGDMKAVIRAILLDDEALSPATTLTAAEYQKFGKLKEPMLRLSALLRAFDYRNSAGRYEFHYGLDNPESGISQAPLQSPTVFNYYNPEFAPPGPVSMASAIAPEFEITTTTSIAATQNYFGRLVTDTSSQRQYRQAPIWWVGDGCNYTSAPENCLRADVLELFAIADNSTQLMQYLNLVLMAGTLSPANQAALAAALDAAYPVSAMPAPPASPDPGATAYNTWLSQITTWQDRRRDRVRGALWLAVHTPEFQIQR